MAGSLMRVVENFVEQRAVGEACIQQWADENDDDLSEQITPGSMTIQLKKLICITILEKGRYNADKYVYAWLYLSRV